jgi:hypothetical protein
LPGSDEKQILIHRWKIAYESTVGAFKLRLPESFKSAVKAQGARS